jgi:hypothetical protein
MPEGEWLFTSNGYSEKALSIISYAAGAWEFDSHIAVMHDSPALTVNTIHMANKRGLTTSGNVDYSDLSDYARANHECHKYVGS